VAKSGSADVGSRNRALNRIVAEISSGLRHGYFEYSVTCEVTTQGRRRLILHVGKTYQFLISSAECEAPERWSASHDGGVEDSD
jgi:hypothetical protein